MAGPRSWPGWNLQPAPRDAEPCAASANWLLNHDQYLPSLLLPTIFLFSPLSFLQALWFYVYSAIGSHHTAHWCFADFSLVSLLSMVHFEWFISIAESSISLIFSATPNRPLVPFCIFFIFNIVAFVSRNVSVFYNFHASLLSFLNPWQIVKKKMILRLLSANSNIRIFSGCFSCLIITLIMGCDFVLLFMLHHLWLDASLWEILAWWQLTISVFL